MQPRRSKVIPYMKIVSETVMHLLKPLSTCVAHRPAAFIKQSVSPAKSKMKPRQKLSVVYKVVCLGDDCSKYYVNQSGTNTATQMSCVTGKLWYVKINCPCSPYTRMRQDIRKMDVGSPSSWHNQGPIMNVDSTCPGILASKQSSSTLNWMQFTIRSAP